ncbi:hypothetical protein FGD67_08975 [Colwellia sp. M166]|jgi:hypothetical protein|uniref:hypothetical protein n=1 Tax=Colwellia sp. M166 TaxID=2583805 RepID=UPI00211E195E|nr:hypothetical protein [Colwellia sp. M166]UUO23331.1 hypothetical protein FGD67_08975 [Colwellia sp. M166]|tara:strand:+ start:23125 stop:23661 length:537 start_codon:yes stop_codon:yes gene_type:complete
MPNNKNSKKEQQPDVTPTNELDQLRQIVFGAAEQQLKQQIASTRSDIEQALSKQNSSFNDRLVQMQENINKRFTELEQKLQLFDKNHDDNEASIEKNLASLSSEHEMFTSATQQDFKNIEQAIDHESQLLTGNFNEQLEQLKTHLEAVSNELSSSKTDRKTLAKLLATMATNLEDDQI